MNSETTLVVSQVTNRGRNFILQVADLMIQRVINGLIILMLNMASSNYTDLPPVKVWAIRAFQLGPRLRGCWSGRPSLAFPLVTLAGRAWGMDDSPHRVLLGLPWICCEVLTRTVSRRSLLVSLSLRLWLGFGVGRLGLHH